MLDNSVSTLIGKGEETRTAHAINLAEIVVPMIGHVAARHGLKKGAELNLINGLFIPMAFLIFSPGAEEEADQLGAQYMSVLRRR